MINKRILSTLLALAILLSCVGWTPAQAQGTVTTYAQGTCPADVKDPADPATPTTLPKKDEKKDGFINRESIVRLYDEEGDDLNKIVYLNNDGTRTMHLYDYPVKYRDASGEIHDISLEIADGTTELNRFQSAANSIMTAFPSKASDGISLSGEGVSIKLIPSIPEADTNTIHMTGNAKRIDSKTISYDYDAKTTIEYSLTYTGFKEDIVVSEYTGQTEYEFLLQTNGLALTQIDGSFYLTDENGKIKAAIGDVIVFTADEKNNTMGTMEAETLKENHSYLLTIVLDAQYLADPNTAYPIRIDPTIDINYDANGSGAIEDVTIYSKVTPDGASTSLFVGLRETRGISRILMRFPNLDLSSLAGATVVSAEVTLRDLICEGTYLDVYCYPFVGADWTESTASWSMTQDWGPELDSEVISYSNGVNANPKHRYAFDITAAVQGWISGTYSKAKGLIFKTSDAVETADTYEQRQFASYNRTNYRPTFTMTYTSTVEITFSDVMSVDVQTAGEKNYFKFRPTVTGEYVFYSSSIYSGDPIVSLYNSNQGLISSDDDGGGSSQFRLSAYLVAGSTYYIEAGHNDNLIGQYNIYIIRDSNLSNGKYYFQNHGTSQYLDIHGPVEQYYLHQWTFSYGDQAKWNITRASNGYYTIQSLYGSKKYIAISTTNVSVNNVVLQDSIANSTYWKIYTNSAGQLYIEPKLAAGKVLYAPNTSTGTELQLANIGSASGEKQMWSPISFQYAYSVNHYYDNGFDVRFPWAVAELPEYQRIVSQIFLRIFGLATNVNSIQEYVSFADLCQGTPVLLSQTIEACTHASEHKRNANVVDHLIDTYGAGTTTLVKNIWTGHDLSFRAASYPLDYIILIPPDYETRADNIYTLLHETSHQLGAKDHYCLGNGITPCGNQYCWDCYKSDAASADCIMYRLYFDIENKLLSGDLSTIYCDECLSSIYDWGIPKHLDNHHQIE